MKKIVILLFLTLIFSGSAKAANYITCEEAMQAEQPFVLYFHSDTCAACKHFNPIFSQVVDKSSYNVNVVDVNFSYSQEKNECSSVDVKAIPAVFVVNSQENTYSKIKYETYFDNILFTESLMKLMGK